MLGLRSVRFLGIPNYLPCRQETLKQSTGLTIQICHLTIKKAGDKGPEQNYRRKIKKMIKKKEARSESDAPPVSISFLDKLLKSEKTVDETEPATNLSDILSDMKIYIRTDDDIRRRLGMPTKSTSPVDHSAPLKPRSRVSLSFTEGKRLGIFNKPSPDSSVMPPEEWDFYQEDEARQISILKKFRPDTNMFEKMIEDSKYMWKYPIDNESYNSESEDVGFEEHVFLDHLLEEGFPKKGPVRHFMELVVTGLSNNPHYTPEEKRAHVNWFREYFSQFPEEELQLPTDIPSISK